MNYRKIQPGPDDLDRRIDRIIRKGFPDLSLGEIYKYLRKGKIRVNHLKKKPDYRLQPGDYIEISDFIEVPASDDEQNESVFKLEIIAENRDLLIINKPAGLLVHGDNSLTGKVSAYLRDRIPDSLSFVPGPLHRLDRNTSGIVTFGKSLEGARKFSRLLRENMIDKYYLAIMRGITPPEGLWEDSLTRSGGISRIAPAGAGKPAIMSFRRLASGGDKSLVLVKLHTGRTHQIRAQASGHGHPLTGDIKYRGGRSRNGYLLHAWLILPVSEDLPPLPVSAPLPGLFRETIISGFDSIDIDVILQNEKKKIFSDLEDKDGKDRMGR